MYKIGKQGRRHLGTLGREHVMQNYNFVKLQQKWVEIIDKVVEERDTYNGIRFKEIA